MEADLEKEKQWRKNELGFREKDLHKEILAFIAVFFRELIYVQKVMFILYKPCRNGQNFLCFAF